MKRFFYSVLAAATMLFATTSCSQDEEIVGGDSAKTQKVSFTVQLPGEDVESRTITSGNKTVTVGGGQLADKLIWALYEKGKEDCLDSGVVDGTVNEETSKNEFTADIDMVKGLTYNVLFFAYNSEGCAFQINDTPEETDLKALKLKSSLSANQESYDAFVKCHQHVVNDETVTTVTLKRPFAQVNVATTESDLEKADKLKALVAESDLTISGVPTQYNVMTGEATETGTITYQKAEFLKCSEAGEDGYPNEAIIVDQNTYKYLTMAYVLAGETETSAQSMHQAVFNFYRDGEQTPFRTIDLPNLPIQRNWRTNIIGDILTQTESFKIVIDEQFVDDHNILEGEVVNVATVADLQEQINNATGPTIIKFTQDIGSTTGRSANATFITITQKEGVDLVIDGCGYEFDGTFYLKGQARSEGAETLTFKNIDFVHSGGDLDFISCDETTSTERYAHNVTVENCTFTGDKDGDVVGMRYRQCYDMKVVNCTAKGLHSLMWATGGNKITIDEVTLENCKSGVSFGTTTNVVVRNSNIAVTEYGIRADGSVATSLVIENTEISAATPVIVRKTTAAYNVALEGENTLIKTGDYHVVFTNGSDDADYVEPTGTYSITGAEEFSVYPIGIKVTNGEDLVKYLEAGEKVIMANDIEVAENTKITLASGITSSLDLNGYTLSSTNNESGNAEFFLVKGELNIIDGTIEYKYTGADQGWSAMSTIFDITAGGVLNMNGVTANNLGGTDMNFAVHMNNWGEVTLNADNCQFLATYCGVRVFNSGYDNNNVTIKNSKLTGSTRAFWVHNYIGDFNSPEHTDEAIKARLVFDIFNNNNVFEITGQANSPIRYGFSNTVYYGETGMTPTEELQAALDSAVEGTTIQLTPGVEYGEITIRPTANSNTTYKCGDDVYTDVNEFKSLFNDGNWHPTPEYTTTLKNVTIVGAEGATIAGFVASAGHHYGNVYDCVREKQYTSGSAYYYTLNINGLTFKNVAFTGQVNINTSDENGTEIDGVKFEECSFTTGGKESTNGAALRYYNEANNGNVKNITVNKCTFNSCYQGVYVHHVNGVTVTNSEFDTIGHNAIALQGHSGAVNLKKVVITGNTFKNVSDRIIRFNEVGADSQITIQNNVATDSGDEDGEVIKATSIAAGVTTDIKNNNWGKDKVVVNDELKDKSY